jgi:hypothetical protein
VAGTFVNDSGETLGYVHDHDGASRFLAANIDCVTSGICYAYVYGGTRGLLLTPVTEDE